MRVLVVEDDPVILSQIVSALSKGGMVVTIESKGGHADRTLAQSLKTDTQFDAVVLDLSLPGMDGLDVLRGVRNRGDHTPVIVLTARIALLERVAGLETGADDYLGKPFQDEELIARINAISRRATETRRISHRLGNLEFNTGTRSFKVNGAVLKLQARSQAILEVLFKRGGQLVLKETLANIDQDGSTHEAIDTQLSRIRRKLKDSESKVYIETHCGVGYILKSETDQ